MLFLGLIFCDFCARHDDKVQGPSFPEGVVYLLKSVFEHGQPHVELTRERNLQNARVSVRHTQILVS